jgi:hypothetical protein
MGKQSRINRIRQWFGGVLFTLAGKVDESFDVWLDDAPRRTHLPGDDEYPEAASDDGWLSIASVEPLIEAVLDRPFADPDDDAAQAARALRRVIRGTVS